MAQRFQLKALSIVLKRHSVSELKKIYKDATGKNAPSGISHFQLVKELSSKTSFRELETSWMERLYANNTTIKVYRFQDENEAKYTDGLNVIEKKFTKAAWKQLCNEGYNPSKLHDDTRLMHVSIIGDKAYFLFVSPGKKREVLQGLSVEYLLQPQFTIATWYNKDSILQVRGQEKSAQVVAKIVSYIRQSTGKMPVEVQAEIPDEATFNKLKTALGGRGTKGRFNNPTDEVTEVVLKANADTELLDTKRSKNLIKDNFDLNAAGIDFDYKKRSYTVWISFNMGTFWLRSGDVTEDVLDYLQKKIISVTKV